MSNSNINPQSPKEAQRQLARLRAEVVRLRVKHNTLNGRVSSSASVEGSRSGGLGKQRKQGGQAPTLRTLHQEQELLAQQIVDTQETIVKLEAWLAAHAEGAAPADAPTSATPADAPASEA